MADKCVVRNQAYKRGGLNKRERHNERKNAEYMNDDIIPERAGFNIHYKRCEGGYEQTFDKMLSDGVISTRGLPNDPHIVDELVFDVNSAYFERHGGYEYARAFYNEAYRLAATAIGGKQYVLSAVMHADERNKALSEELGRDVYHYHLHVVYVPVVEKEVYFRKNNKNPELAGKLKEVITQVSHSKKWPRYKTDRGWVNSYSLLQDRFFEHMRAAGFSDIDRGERGSTAGHLSVLEYKAQQEAQRASVLSDIIRQREETAAAIDGLIEDKERTAAELEQKTEKKREQLNSLNKKTAAKKKEAAEIEDIEKLGNKRGLMGGVTLSADNWTKFLNLVKEGINSRGIIARLRKKVDEAAPKIDELEKQLKAKDTEKSSLMDTLQYNQAKIRAPRRMAETIADIMRNPPEQERQYFDRYTAKQKGAEL
ncbi:MAG: plasmid recombination protein [Clostridiales bacterium]|nr:plasmid recombination protein [Clostridiales bacterium]